MSKCREAAVLREALIFEEDGKGFLRNALCVTGVAVFFLAVTSLLVTFIRNFVITTAKTGFD
jgi:hypothetical protein